MVIRSEIAVNWLDYSAKLLNISGIPHFLRKNEKLIGRDVKEQDNGHHIERKRGRTD